MDWIAQVVFQADDAQSAGVEIASWGLPAGLQVTLSPIIIPFSGTTTDKGEVEPRPA